MNHANGHYHPTTRPAPMTEAERAAFSAEFERIEGAIAKALGTGDIAKHDTTTPNENGIES
jgi:hypothetical protein